MHEMSHITWECSTIEKSIVINDKCLEMGLTAFYKQWWVGPPPNGHNGSSNGGSRCLKITMDNVQWGVFSISLLKLYMNVIKLGVWKPLVLPNCHVQATQLTCLWKTLNLCCHKFHKVCVGCHHHESLVCLGSSFKANLLLQCNILTQL
jgi:hypothetical protein